MKVLVTGGAGFIGSNMVELLLKQGADIIVIDNLHTGSRENLKEFSDKIKFIKKNCGDITKKEVEGIEGIFHFGIYSSSPMYRENPNLFGKAINEFLVMLKIAGELNIKIVWASTSSIYNGNETPWRENMPILVKDYYTEARYCMERLADLHYEWFGTKTIGMRFFSVYGPREEAKGKYANLVSQFLWLMRKGKTPVIYGDGTQRRDFIYVTDVTKCVSLAFNSSLDHGIFNLGTGVSYSLNELVEITNRILGTEIEPHYTENPIKGYIHETLADTSKLEKILGFKATVDLKGGIKKLVESK